LCQNAMIEEVYVKGINLQSCGTCGFPYVSKMMPYFKEKDMMHKLDFLYAFCEHLDGKHGLEFGRSPRGNILPVYVPSMLAWSWSDEVRGSILYAIINTADDGSFYEFRGVYSNPYFAQDVCDRMNEENERRGIKATARYERVPLNHPCGGSMFREASKMSEETITGEAAIRLSKMLDDPEKYNPKWKEQQKRIKEALEQFPNPTEPTELDIDLTDNIEDE